MDNLEFLQHEIETATQAHAVKLRDDVVLSLFEVRAIHAELERLRAEKRQLSDALRESDQIALGLTHLTDCLEKGLRRIMDIKQEAAQAE